MNGEAGVAGPSEGGLGLNSGLLAYKVRILGIPPWEDVRVKGGQCLRFPGQRQAPIGH